MGFGFTYNKDLVTWYQKQNKPKSRKDNIIRTIAERTCFKKLDSLTNSIHAAM